PNGSYDNSFGLGGTITLTFNTEVNFTNALFLQPNGKIIIGITTGANGSGPDGDFALMRLLPDGSPDDAFGIHGKWIEPFSNATSSRYEDYMTDLVASPDGARLYAIGQTTMPAPEDIGATANYNVGIASFAIDVPLTVDAGGPYGP